MKGNTLGIRGKKYMTSEWLKNKSSALTLLFTQHLTESQWFFLIQSLHLKNTHAFTGLFKTARFLWRTK